MPTTTFTYTGSRESYTVPSDITEVTVKCWGAGGGDGADYPGGTGGYGERTISVSPGETLYVRVGGQGSIPAGGWPNGGDGRDNNGGSGGGGGSSGVRRSGDSWSDIVALGGGGGGGSNLSDFGTMGGSGGDGGGSSGGPGGGDAYGRGGSQTSGGSGGSGNVTNGNDGSQFSGANSPTSSSGCDPGAGGGGYYGGGSAGIDESQNDYETGGGGGGSGYGSTVSRGSGNSGDGQVEISYTEPPSSPQNTAQTIQDDETILVDWDAPSSGDPPDEYVIEVSEDGAAYASVATIDASSTQYTDTVSGSVDAFRYRVLARNSGGDSSWSYTATVATNPKGLAVDAVRGTEIDLSWTNPDQHDGTDVHIAEASGSTEADYSVEQSLAATASSTTVTGLENGERYYFRVQSTYSSAGGVDSPLTGEVDGTTTLPSPTVDAVDASAEDELTISYTLTDNSPDGDVEVLRSTDGTTGSVVATMTDLSLVEYVDTGLSDGEEYHYTLRRNTDHVSAESGQASAITVLPAPTDLTSLANDATSIDLGWTANHDYGDTRVEFKRSSDATWTTDETVPRSTESHTITGLLNGEEYDLRAVAQTETEDA